MLHDDFQQVTRLTHKWSNYFAMYDKLLAPYRGREVIFVEIGVMNGGSLQMWRRYLGAQARIIGIDLNPAACEMITEGFEIVIGNQADPAFWRSFFAQIGDVDVVVDDGGHTNRQQIVTAVEVIPHINDGGLLVTEDTHTSYMRGEFGNPSPYSFINFAKYIADVVNSRNPRVTSRLDDSRNMARMVYSIEFFDSIVAVHVDRRRCDPPTVEEAGSIQFTASDYRHYTGSVFGFERLRAAYRRLPPWVRRALRFASQGFVHNRAALQNRRARGYFR